MVVFVKSVYVLNKYPLFFPFSFLKKIFNMVSRGKDLCWSILLIFSRTVSRDMFCLGQFRSFA